MSTTQQLATALSGRYQVEREVGAGGMATVYRARDLRHDRPVALKVLRPELSAILGAERFLKEIRTTANLQHPHILPLHDSGEAHGLVFYVMPFVEGESLRDRLTRETQLPVDDAVRIAREVASALDYAHRRGVVHRDIKPENILLHDGQALVADFGIALAVSAVGGGTRLTETGMSLGTPHYMSPEQAMGEREITARSDVYALGCVLYEMLLGEPPFTGPTAQAIVARVMTEEPRGLTAQRRSVPPHVEAVVHTALAKLPADRFATAAEFAAALDARGAAATTASPSAAPRARRARWLVPAAVGVAALALGLALGRSLLARPGGADVRYAQKTFSDDVVSLARWAPDGKTIVFSAAPHLQAPELYVIRPDYPEPQPLGAGPAHLLSVSSQGELAVLVRPRSVIPGHYEGTLARMPVGGGAPRELVDSVRDADWSPDGSRLAIVRTVNGKDRLEVHGGRVLVETSGWISDPRWAPDGRSIAFVQHPYKWETRGTVDVVDLEGRGRTLTEGVFAGLKGVAWSRGGGEVLFSAAVPDVHQMIVLGVTPRGRMRRVLNGAGSLVMEDVAADGRWLVSRDITSHRLLLRTARDTTTRSIGWLENTFSPAISGDGRLVAFGEWSTESGVNYSVFMRATDGGKAVRLGEGSPEGFSRDGRWLLAVVPSRPARLMLYPTGAGTERVVPTDSLESVTRAVWGAGDSTVLYCGLTRAGANGCWERALSGGAARAATLGDLGPSPDGRHIVVRDAGGRVLLLTAGGDTVRAVPAVGPDDVLVRWSPDGRAAWVRRRGTFRVEAVDLATGTRSLVLDGPVNPPNSGLSGLVVSDDATRYAYIARQLTSSLFAVEGVR